MDRATRRGMLWLEALLVALILSLAIGVARAADNTGPAPVKVTMQGQAQADGTVLVTARLTRADGKALGNQTVELYEVTEFFMTAPVRVDSATTDATGSAQLKFQPTRDGHHKLQASFAGDAGLAAGSATLEMDLKSTLKPYRPAPRDLSELRFAASGSALAIASAVWLFLFAVLARVVWVVRRAAPEDLPHSGTAAAPTSSD